MKLSLVILYVLVTSLLPAGAWLAFAMLLALPLGAALFAEIGLTWLLKRALVALPFAMAAVTILFSTEGSVLFAVQLGSWHLRATGPGLVRFLSIVVKSWLSVQVAIILAATTPFPALTGAMRALRLPAVLVAVISFMWRYIFVLVDEVMRLRRAREARSASLPGHKSGGSVTWRARVAGGMAGNLFIRSHARSERIYQAMAARGYQGEFRTLTPLRMMRVDWLLGSAVAVYLFGVLLAGWILG